MKKFGQALQLRLLRRRYGPVEVCLTEPERFQAHGLPPDWGARESDLFRAYGLTEAMIRKRLHESSAQSPRRDDA